MTFYIQKGNLPTISQFFLISWQYILKNEAPRSFRKEMDFFIKKRLFVFKTKLIN